MLEDYARYVIDFIDIEFVCDGAGLSGLPVVEAELDGTRLALSSQPSEPATVGLITSGLDAFCQAVGKKGKGVKQRRLPAAVWANEAHEGREGNSLPIAGLAERHIGQRPVVLNTDPE